MSTKYMKSLIAVMLLAALAGCATGGSTNTSAFPAATVGEAEG
jgi:predicted small lipoprotein YifL